MIFLTLQTHRIWVWGFKGNEKPPQLLKCWQLRAASEKFDEHLVSQLYNAFHLNAKSKIFQPEIS